MPTRRWSSRSSDTHAFAGSAVRRLLDVLERKIVTILFADLVGSTGIAAHSDPERLREIMTGYRDAVAAEIARHGGTMEKFIGDAAMAVFGFPRAHEDDPQRALGAAFAVRSAVAALRDGGLAVRIGVQTGQVIADPEAAKRGDFLVTGEAVHLAQRLQSAAAPGEILVDERTWVANRARASFETVRDLELKGVRERVTAYRAVMPREPVAPPLAPAAFAGHGLELAMLKILFQKIRTDRRSHLVTLVGPPGIGKTRLWEEFRAMIATEDPTAVVRGGACKPYGEAHLYCPVAGVVTAEVSAELDELREPRPFIDLLAADVRRICGERGQTMAAERLAGVIASSVRHDCPLDPPPSREELFRAWRFPLEAHAATEPVVVAFDNLQWSSDEPIDFIECLAARCADMPLLVLAIARPEFLERRPRWGSGGSGATTLTVGPLGRTDLAAVIHSVIGGAADETLVEAVEERAGGNPGFAIELVRSLRDAGAIAERDGRWTLTRPLGELEIPNNIQAMIAARIDGLPPDEKRTLLLASYAAYSRFFYDRPIRLTGDLSGPQVDAALDGLLLKGLISEMPEPGAPGMFGYLAGTRMFAFQQILLREVAHDMVPKAQRPRLHTVFANWLEELMADRPDTRRVLEQIAASKLYEAWSIQHERGEIDPGLAERALRYCVSAAEADASCRAPREASDDLKRALAIARGSLPAEAARIEARLVEVGSIPVEPV